MFVWELTEEGNRVDRHKWFSRLSLHFLHLQVGKDLFSKLTKGQTWQVEVETWSRAVSRQQEKPEYEFAAALSDPLASTGPLGLLSRLCWLPSSALNWLFGRAVRLCWWDCCEAITIPKSWRQAGPSTLLFFCFLFAHLFLSRSVAGVCHLVLMKIVT